MEPGEDDEAKEVAEVERLSGGVETTVNFESLGEEEETAVVVSWRSRLVRDSMRPRCWRISMMLLLLLLRRGGEDWDCVGEW